MAPSSRSEKNLSALRTVAVAIALSLLFGGAALAQGTLPPKAEPVETGEKKDDTTATSPPVASPPTVKPPQPVATHSADIKPLVGTLRDLLTYLKERDQKANTPKKNELAGAMTNLLAYLKDRDEKASKKKQNVAQGECSTPRKAIMSFLIHLNEDSDQYNRAKSTSCFDDSKLEHPSKESPKLAEKLKKILDSQGMVVDPGDLPDDPDYKDGKDGPHSYALLPNDLSGIAWQRKTCAEGEPRCTKEGQWLLTPESLNKIPELYKKAFPWNLDRLIESLPAWLKVRILGLQAWQMLGIILLIFLALVLKRVVVYIIGRYATRLFGKLKIKWARSAIDKAAPPIGGLVMAGVLFLGIPILQLSARASMFAFLSIRVLAAFSIVWMGYRLVDVLTDILAEKADKTESKLDDQLVPLVRKSLKLIMAVIGGIFILQNLKVNVGSLLATLGLGGLAFALAAKDTVANFFGSLMIFIDKPFQVGDSVKIGSDIEGTVEEVGFRTSRIRTFYNSLVTFPNARITTSSVDNLGAREYRRYKTVLGLTYDTPPEKIQAFCEGIRAIIQSLDGMRKDYYVVEFQEFSTSSLDILIYSFMEVPGFEDERRVRTNFNLEIMRLARELGVDFAFPTQTLYVEKDAEEGDDAAVESKALANVVRSFGPGGKLARPKGISISKGYRPEADVSEATGESDG